MTRRAPPVSLSRVPRPTLQSVLRRAHLRLAFVAVTMAAVSLIVVAVIALRAYAGNNLNLLARSLGYTVEAALVFGDRVAAEAIGMIAGDEDVAQVVVTDSKGQPFATWQLPAGSGIARLERVVADLALPGPVTAPVVHDGIVVGHVVVRGRGHQFFGFLLGGVGGILGCLAVSVIGAYISSQRCCAASFRRCARWRRPRAARTCVRAARRPIDCRTQPARRRLQCIARRIRRVAEHAARRERVARTQGDARCAHGLPNRVQFESRLALALGEAGVTGSGSRSCISIATASRKSTTASATTPATRC